MLIMIEQPFRIGHTISVGGTQGTVEDVGFRSTRIRAPDNSLIQIPNNTVVNATVKSFITPLIAAIGGQPDFSALTFTINGSVFTYGAWINAVISFLIIAAVIFFLVVKPLNAFLARRNEEDGTAEPESPAEDVRLLTEIRDLLAERPA